MAQSKRKFYKTEIKVTVLSEDPYDYESLSQVAFDIEEGECSGQVKVEKQTTLTGQKMAEGTPSASHNELDKIKEVAPISNEIGEFLDWLESEKRTHLCEYTEPYGQFQQIHTSKQNLLAEFFGIDLKKAEQ